MSIKAMSAVWDHSQAKGSDLLVLLYIADRCNDDGWGAYPSRTKIAKACRLSERAVQYAIQSLVKSGELAVQVNAGPKGCNLYQINMVCLEGANPAPEQNLRGSKPRQQRGARIAPKPSVEPSIDSTANAVGDDEPKPLPEHGPAQQVIAAYCRCAGIAKPANYGFAAKWAQNIVDAGVSPDEIPGLYAFVAEWAKGVDLPLMFRQIDKFRASQHSATPARHVKYPPQIQERIDRHIAERTADGRPILPLPDALQKTIDDYLASIKELGLA